MRMRDAEAQFVRWLKANRDLSANTLRAYSSDIAAFRNHVGLHVLVEGLSGDEIVTFVEAQRADGLSPASIRRRLATLRSFIGWLRERDILDSDPWVQISLRVRKPRTLPRPVDTADLRRLLDHLTRTSALRGRKLPEPPLTRPYEATTLLAVSLMLATGLRVSEVAGLRCIDLDRADSTIRVRGKGSRERTVFLPDAWSQHLVNAYFETRSHLRITHQHLLFSKAGGPVTPAAIRTRLTRASRDAQLLRRVTPHMLRHSAATHLIESGVDIRYVQRLLGHASLSTTEIYTHVSDVALRHMVTQANVLGRCLRMTDDYPRRSQDPCLVG
jgi:site-specific recombinase XerD